MMNKYENKNYNGGEKMKTYEVDGNDFTIKDLSNFFFQIRGFPTILFLGKCMGEGQNGGRYITEKAKELEKRIVDDLGDEEYMKQMNKLMSRRK